MDGKYILKSKTPLIWNKPQDNNKKARKKKNTFSYEVIKLGFFLVVISTIVNEPNKTKKDHKEME